MCIAFGGRGAGGAGASADARRNPIYQTMRAGISRMTATAFTANPRLREEGLATRRQMATRRGGIPEGQR